VTDESGVVCWKNVPSSDFHRKRTQLTFPTISHGATVQRRVKPGKEFLFFMSHFWGLILRAIRRNHRGMQTDFQPNPVAL
jgi:hypothetical protein